MQTIGEFLHLRGGVDLLGFAGGAVTALIYTPQVINVWRARRGDAVKIGSSLAYALSSGLWIAYALSVGSLPVLLANAFLLGLAITTIVASGRHPLPTGQVSDL